RLPQMKWAFMEPLGKFALIALRVHCRIEPSRASQDDVEEGIHGFVYRTLPLSRHRPPCLRIRRISLVCTVGPNHVTLSKGGMLFVNTSSTLSSGRGRCMLSQIRNVCSARIKSLNVWLVAPDLQPESTTTQRPCWFNTPGASPSPPKLI